MTGAPAAGEAALRPAMRRLRLSPTLTGYIARQYLFWFGTLYCAIVAIIFLATIVDLLDRLATKDVSLTITLKMALMKLPYLSQEVMPFTILFAAMATFWRLTRSHELVVTRAAGVSVWQFLLPVLGSSVVIGMLAVSALNPLASALLSRYESLEASYMRNQESKLAVSESGLWLRQADDGGQSVIHAERVRPGSIALQQVIVFRYAEGDRFRDRIDAREAQLEPGRWVLFDAWLSHPGERSEEHTSELPSLIRISYAVYCLKKKKQK